ncbi:MAG: ribosome maturation factor RimP [Rickettsiaceae bacterium]
MIEQKISSTIAEAMNELGLKIIKISLHGENTKTLEIAIDNIDGSKVSIKDCQLASEKIGLLLDAENIINSKYNLEVVSVGWEKPILTIEDYYKFIDYPIKIKLKEPLNGKRKYSCTISSISNDQLTITLLDDSKQKISNNGKKNNDSKYKNNKVECKPSGPELVIPIDLVASANLLLTEDIFRKLLNKTH